MIGWTCYKHKFAQNFHVKCIMLFFFIGLNFSLVDAYSYILAVEYKCNGKCHLLELSVEPILTDQLNWQQNTCWIKSTFFFKLRRVWISLNLKRVWYSTFKSSIPGLSLIISNESSLMTHSYFSFKDTRHGISEFSRRWVSRVQSPEFFLETIWPLPKR